MVRLAMNYAEWCRLSGLYLANVSHVDRYRTYAKLLSPAGLTVVIVSEFLEDAHPSLDVDNWRTLCVHEFGPDQTERIERTVSALREIGAEELAQKVASSRSKSPIDAIERMIISSMPDLEELRKSVNPLELLASLQESLSQLLPGSGAKPTLSGKNRSLGTSQGKSEHLEAVETLLEQFSQSHRDNLQADIDRHGDPRLEPGFTIEQRLRDLDAMRTLWISHQNQADAIETLTNVMKRIPTVVAQKGEGQKRAAQHLKQLTREFREKSQELRRVAEADRSEPLKTFWPKLQAFETKWAELIRPDVIGDALLRQAAEEIGEFTAESKRKTTTLAWETPRGLECDWTTFHLTVVVPAKSKTALQAAIQEVERLRTRFPQLLDDWRRQTLASFREIYLGQMDESELEEYDLDEEGNPSDAGILRHAGAGSIVLSTEDPEGIEFHRSAFLSVEWDEEHGFELDQEADFDESTFVPELESVFDQRRPESTSAVTSSPDVPGIATLEEAAASLSRGLSLRLQIEMTSPPVTQLEKVYYGEVGCHYRLTFEVGNSQVTFNDTRSPRQDYLHAKTWTEALFAPIAQWPELRPLWETLTVQEYNLSKAIKSRRYQPTPRPDLHAAAQSALEKAFSTQEQRPEDSS